METQFKKVARVEKIENSGKYMAYDIETSDAEHLFFADNILVHNSLFFCWEKVFESFDFQGDKLEFILNAYDYRLKDMFKGKLEDFAADYGVPNVQDFELEYIAESIIFLTKKRYVGHVLWTDGMYHEKYTEYVYKGVELIRSSTPKFSRERIPNLIEILFANPYTVNYRDLLREMREIKKEFMVSDIEEICFQGGTNTYNKWVVDDKTSLSVTKGCPMGVKASALHNFMIYNDAELSKKYRLIANGDKVKMYYTTDPRYPVFGFLRNRYPYEIAPPINYELQFKKHILNIINRFIEACGFPPFNERLSLIQSLF